MSRLFLRRLLFFSLTMFRFSKSYNLFWKTYWRKLGKYFILVVNSSRQWRDSWQAGDPPRSGTGSHTPQAPNPAPWSPPWLNGPQSLQTSQPETWCVSPQCFPFPLSQPISSQSLWIPLAQIPPLHSSNLTTSAALISDNLEHFNTYPSTSRLHLSQFIRVIWVITLE